MALDRILTWLPNRLLATTILAMTFTPWQFIVVAVAGWMNRQQQEVIEYLRTENSVLREKLGGKCLLLNADQKRRLAACVAAIRMLASTESQVGAGNPENTPGWAGVSRGEGEWSSQRLRPSAKRPLSTFTKRLSLPLVLISRRMAAYSVLAGVLPPRTGVQ